MRIPSQPAGSVLAVYALAMTSPISLRISVSLRAAIAGAEGRKSSHAAFAVALELDAVASAKSVCLTVSNTDMLSPCRNAGACRRSCHRYGGDRKASSVGPSPQ